MTCAEVGMNHQYLAEQQLEYLVEKGELNPQMKRKLPENIIH
jgi:hypothetical protein